MDVIWVRVFSAYFNEQVMSKGAEEYDLEGTPNCLVRWKDLLPLIPPLMHIPGNEIWILIGQVSGRGVRDV